MDSKHTGMDFRYREQVASHYQSSVRLKSRLRLVASIHISLVIALLAKIVFLIALLLVKPDSQFSRDVAKKFNIAIENSDPLDILLTTTTRSEFFWLASALPIILAELSVRRNDVQMLNAFIITNLLFSFVPVGCAVIGKATELYDYYETRKADLVLFGVPTILIWYLVFSIATQVHFFAEFTAFQLRKQWRTPASTKPKRN